MSCRAYELDVSISFSRTIKQYINLPKNSVMSLSPPSIEKHELWGDADEFLDDGGGVGRFDSGL